MNTDCKHKLSYRILVVGLVIFSIFGIIYLAQFKNSFVHPHQYFDHLPKFAKDSPGFVAKDFLKPFQIYGAEEQRPRFLAYGLALVDYKVRLFVHHFMVLNPIISLTSIVYVGLSLWLFLKITRMLFKERESCLVAFLVFLTSIGFLSCISNVFMPGKPLSILVVIGCFYLGLRLKNACKVGQYLYEVDSKDKYYLLALIFVGLFLDEVPLFVFMMMPIFFWDLFFPRSLAVADWVRFIRNGLFFAIPLFVFLFLVICLVPYFTEWAWGYRFDYLGTILAKNRGAVESQVSMISNPRGGFTLQSFWHNLMSLFGQPFVPKQVTPMAKHSSAGGVISGQEINLIKLVVMGGLSAALVVLVAVVKRAHKSLIVRCLAVSAAFVLFYSILGGRHVAYISGYYYAGVFSFLFALFLGACYEAICLNWCWLRMIACVGVMYVGVVQWINFDAINKSYIDFHNQGWAVHTAELLMPGKYPVPDMKAQVTGAELKSIHQAWKDHKLEDYYDEHGISPGALYLARELDWLDSFKPNRTKGAVPRRDYKGYVSKAPLPPPPPPSTQPGIGAAVPVVFIPLTKESVSELIVNVEKALGKQDSKLILMYFADDAVVSRDVKIPTGFKHFHFNRPAKFEEFLKKVFSLTSNYQAKRSEVEITVARNGSSAAVTSRVDEEFQMAGIKVAFSGYETAVVTVDVYGKPVIKVLTVRGINK